MLVCFDMVGRALSHFSCDETNDDICRVPVLYAPVVAKNRGNVDSTCHQPVIYDVVTVNN